MVKDVMKKIIILACISVLMIFLSGCAKSSLSDNEVIKYTEIIANRSEHTSDLGENVKVKNVEKHYGKIFISIARIFECVIDCDEVWMVNVTSDKWKNKTVTLYRRGKNLYITYN